MAMGKNGTNDASDAAKPEISDLPDEEVVKLSLKDPSLFALFVDKYEEAFMRAAFSITRSREEAEDILQETFTRIYMNGASYKKQPGASFKSWAYKILVNTSFTHYQKLKKRNGSVSYLDPVLYEDTVVAESNDLTSSADNKAIITETISKMPEHLGRLLKLYFLEDKSYKEIADMENITTTTLKMRLFRAKRMFRKLLSEQ